MESTSTDGAFWFFVMMFIYFIPAIVAHYKEHTKESSIMVVNLFLGWTFLGWVIALAWAVSESKK